jgi:hypothetical protein
VLLNQEAAADEFGFIWDCYRSHISLLLAASS